MGNVVFNHIIDFCFAFDIILHFRTTITDEATGTEITDPKQIAILYLKNKFLIDLMATIPFDSLFSGLTTRDVTGQLSLFSLLKLFRIIRVQKIIAYMNASDNIKHSLKIFKLLFFLAIYIHCQACAWFYYTNFQKTWFPLEKILLG